MSLTTPLLRGPGTSVRHNKQRSAGSMPGRRHPPPPQTSSLVYACRHVSASAPIHTHPRPSAKPCRTIAEAPRIPEQLFYLVYTARTLSGTVACPTPTAPSRDKRSRLSGHNQEPDRSSIPALTLTCAVMWSSNQVSNPPIVTAGAGRATGKGLEGTHLCCADTAGLMGALDPEELRTIAQETAVRHTSKRLRR